MNTECGIQKIETLREDRYDVSPLECNWIRCCVLIMRCFYCNSIYTEWESKHDFSDESLSSVHSPANMKCVSTWKPCGCRCQGHISISYSYIYIYIYAQLSSLPFGKMWWFDVQYLYWYINNIIQQAYYKFKGISRLARSNYSYKQILQKFV